MYIGIIFISQGWKIKDLKHKENGKIKNSWEIEIHEQEPQYGVSI